MLARLLPSALLITAGGAAGAQPTVTRDYGALTCRGFLRLGKDNMAVIICPLRGHHGQGRC